MSACGSLKTDFIPFWKCSVLVIKVSAVLECSQNFKTTLQDTTELLRSVLYKGHYNINPSQASRNVQIIKGSERTLEKTSSEPLQLLC